MFWHFYHDNLSPVFRCILHVCRVPIKTGLSVHIFSLEGWVTQQINSAWFCIPINGTIWSCIGARHDVIMWWWTVYKFHRKIKLKHNLHRNERMCMINIILSHSCMKSWENCEVQIYSRSWLLCLEMLERKTLAWALLIEVFWQKMLILYSIRLPHWTLRLPSNQLLLSTFWGQDEWYSCAKTLSIWRLVSVVMFKWSVKSNGSSN